MDVAENEAKVYALRNRNTVSDSEMRKMLKHYGYSCEPFRGDPDNVIYSITCRKEGYT